jgi:hypothetical protein
MKRTATAPLARLAVALTAVVMLAGLGPARALASDTEQSLLVDDNRLIYTTPSKVRADLEQIAALGFDRIKVSVVWALLAPSPNASREPNFHAADPAAYPAHAWDRYDLVDELAHELGIGVYFQLTAPAPNWAVAPGARSPEHSWSHEPNASEFGQFAEAVGRRYSGSYVVPADQQSTPIVSLPIGGVTLTNPSGSSQPSGSTPLPAVDWWGIWNEPNEHAWLSPQTRRYHGRTVPFSPLLERRLTDAGYAGLIRSGHAHDTILIGETASAGSVRPVAFLRDLYCLSSRYRPLRGTTAAALGCPTSGTTGAFVSAHPALFHAAGYAHHPYSFDHPPTTRFTQGVITLANLGSFERVLDRSLAAYGQPTGMPIYATEWGYKTNPPNPFVHTSLTQQATWLNQGEYMTWRDPRIRALAQFLLYDDRPRQGATPGTLSYWSTFQSGLFYAGGRAKPSLAAFRLPIWVPHAHHGASVTVWGEIRPAAHDQVQYAEVEYRAGSRAPWENLVEVATSNPEGFLLSHIAIAHSGQIRLAWADPATGAVDHSRTVGIS